MELSECEKTQALALQVLLSLTKFNQHRIHEMDCYHGYSMIHQVLIKSKCIVGYHVLKVSHTFKTLNQRDLPNKLEFLTLQDTVHKAGNVPTLAQRAAELQDLSPLQL